MGGCVCVCVCVTITGVTRNYAGAVCSDKAYVSSSNVSAVFHHVFITRYDM